MVVCVIHRTFSIVLMEKSASLPSVANFNFFEILIAQSIIATFKHPKRKKCLTKRIFWKMLFAAPQTFLPRFKIKYWKMEN